MIDAKIIADSAILGSDPLCRLTTFELMMPKWMLAQFNTHGMVRRNAESSRARPTQAILEQVRHDPYRPDVWRYRQRGMQPAEPMSPQDTEEMLLLEEQLRSHTLRVVKKMDALKAAKEDINRYLEPWMWAKVIASSTTWENYFKLRTDSHAQGAHQHLAMLMQDAYQQSQPVLRHPEAKYLGDWHLPYISPLERTQTFGIFLPHIASARCGRVSYARQGEVRGVVEDVERSLSFVREGHWSALEHAAILGNPDEWYGPYRGWISLRKMYAGESGSTAHGTQQDRRPWALRSTREEIEQLWEALQTFTKRHPEVPAHMMSSASSRTGV